MLLALTTGANKGWLASCMAGMGHVIASTVQAITVSLAIPEVGMISETALLTIKYPGAAHLMYMETMLPQARHFGSHDSAAIDKGQNNGRQYGHLIHLQEGFMFAIFNPKVILFFAALFPQCTNECQSRMQNLLLIFSPIRMIACTCFMVYTVAGIAIMKILGKSEHIGKVFGLLIIVVGCRPAFGLTPRSANLSRRSAEMARLKMRQEMSGRQCAESRIVAP